MKPDAACSLSLSLLFLQYTPRIHYFITLFFHYFAWKTYHINNKMCKIQLSPRLTCDFKRHRAHGGKNSDLILAWHMHGTYIHSYAHMAYIAKSEHSPQQRSAKTSSAAQHGSGGPSARSYLRCLYLSIHPSPFTSTSCSRSTVRGCAALTYA
jgi:hypothetical protein